MDGTAQGDDTAFGGDLNAFGLPHGLAHQGILNAVGQVGWDGRRLELDVVADAHNPLQRSHQPFHRASLKIPVDLAAQRDPAFFDGDLDPVLRHRGIPAECMLYGCRDFSIATLVNAQWDDVYFHSQCLQAADPLNRPTRGDLLRIAVQVPGQGNDPVIH